MARQKNPLPPTVDPERKCVKIWLPDEREHRIAFFGAIARLGYWHAWQSDGTTKNAEVAQVWKQIYNQAVADVNDPCNEVETVYPTPEYLDNETGLFLRWRYPDGSVTEYSPNLRGADGEDGDNAPIPVFSFTEDNRLRIDADANGTWDYTSGVLTGEAGEDGDVADCECDPFDVYTLPTVKDWCSVGSHFSFILMQMWYDAHLTWDEVSLNFSVDFTPLFDLAPQIPRPNPDLITVPLPAPDWSESGISAIDIWDNLASYTNPTSGDYGAFRVLFFSHLARLLGDHYPVPFIDWWTLSEDGYDYYDDAVSEETLMNWLAQHLAEMYVSIFVADDTYEKLLAYWLNYYNRFTSDAVECVEVVALPTDPDAPWTHVFDYTLGSQPAGATWDDYGGVYPSGDYNSNGHLAACFTFEGGAKRRRQRPMFYVGANFRPTSIRLEQHNPSGVNTQTQIAYSPNGAGWTLLLNTTTVWDETIDISGMDETHFVWVDLITPPYGSGSGDECGYEVRIKKITISGIGYNPFA